MITRNLHNYFMAQLIAIDTTAVNRSGGTIAINATNSMLNFNGGVSTSLSASVDSRFARTLRIGSGTTEPSYDDYELGRIIDVAPKNITSVKMKLVKMF